MQTIRQVGVYGGGGEQIRLQPDGVKNFVGLKLGSDGIVVIGRGVDAPQCFADGLGDGGVGTTGGQLGFPDRMRCRI